MGALGPVVLLFLASKKLSVELLPTKKLNFERCPTRSGILFGDCPQSVPPLRVAPGQVDRLESWIDEVNGQLEPLTSFVLPGGSVASAWLHLARTVCRRVEIAVWTLHETESVNGNIPRYLNRLSDLLFVFAQLCNDGGRSGVLWVPGQNRE